MTAQTKIVKITEISNQGNGIAYLQDGSNKNQIFEIPFTLPGDVVKIEVFTADENAQVRLQSIITPSPLRTSPRCSHFGKCGTCHFQHIPYKAQLLHKEKLVRESFASQLSSKTTIHPILPSKTLWHYRSHIQYVFRSVDGKPHLGLEEEGLGLNVINLRECYLSPQWFMDAHISIKQWWEESKYLAYCPITNKGNLQSLTLQEGKRYGDRTVVLTIANGNEFETSIHQIEKFVSRIKEAIQPHQPDNQLSIFLRINQSTEDPASFYDLLLYGPGVLRECLKISLLEDAEPQTLYFDVGAVAYFQPNLPQMEAFYNKSLQLAGLDAEDVVFDLNGGVGILGICASKFVKRVVAVDASAEKGELGLKNAEKNQADNFFLSVGDISEILNAPAYAGVKPSIGFINEVQDSCCRAVFKHFFALKPNKILYLSGNPLEQAKNIQPFVDNGYFIQHIQPADLLPHTRFIENTVLLVKE